MNYAIAVIGAVWAFAITYWFFPKIGGKTFFTYVLLSTTQANAAVDPDPRPLCGDHVRDYYAQTADTSSVEDKKEGATRTHHVSVPSSG